METTVYLLSADDVWALRNAESVSFHTWEGRSYVRTYLRDRAPYGKVYSVREQNVFNGARTYHGEDCYREIPVMSSRCEDYGSDGATGEFTGFASVRQTPEWRTIAAGIRTGDGLVFRWVRSNNSENMTRVGYNRDELHMSAGDPAGRPNARTWLVSVEVGPDNSARMVKRATV